MFSFYVRNSVKKRNEKVERYRRFKETEGVFEPVQASESQ